MEQQDTTLFSVEAQELDCSCFISPSSTTMSSSKKSPTVEIKKITHVFRDLLVQYLDPKCVTNSLRFQLGPRFSLIFDASKRSRREGMKELLQAIDEMEDKRGVAKTFMDSLKRSGNTFLHDVIIGKEKLDDNWELHNLLLGTKDDLLKVPPLELLPHLICFENLDREAIRSTERQHGSGVACGELFLRLEAKHPTVIQEVITGLRAIGYHFLAQSLEDVYKDRHGEGNNNPTVEIKTITCIFRDLLVQYLDPKIVASSLRFQLGSRFFLIFDASKRSRREGMKELLQAIDEMEDKRGVAKSFMDSLKRSGNEFLHDVIIGKEKLDDNWELKNLLLRTEADLMMISPLELLPHLKCFEINDREAVRVSEKKYGPQVACSELFSRLEAKHPTVIQEVINGLRAIGNHKLAQSLEDAYMDRHRANDPKQRQPEPEASVTPGYPSRAEEKDVQRKGVSIRPRDDGLAGRDAARGRMEDEKKQRIGEMKRREVGKREEWNIPNQDKHLHIQKARNHPNNHVKLNNLSPAIVSREINRNLDQTNYFEARNEGNIREEERLETGTHSLSSSGVDPRNACPISLTSESEILEGISRENKGNTESTGEVQRGGEQRSGTGEMGATRGIETVDASNDNQDSLIMRNYESG